MIMTDGKKYLFIKKSKFGFGQMEFRNLDFRKLAFLKFEKYSRNNRLRRDLPRHPFGAAPSASIWETAAFGGGKSKEMV